MPDLPNVGETLDGKYALLRVLGKGGMGVVYEAQHVRLKQKCAIKVLSPSMLEQEEIVKRFEREARASAQLGGRHVTRVMDVETTPDGVPYIVMELLTGRDLDVELQQRSRLPYEEAVDYVLQACGAISEAHAAGIIHRDLKPGNLFLAQTPDETVVKVLDFGISKVSDDDAAKLTGAGTLIGTALYMSPEQLKAAAKVDARSDIWSIGVILYELVTGETPWNGTAPQVAAAIVTEDAPDVLTKALIPEPLAAVIHKMLLREPALRFQTIGEVADALAPFAPAGSIGRGVVEQIAKRARQSGPRSLVPASDPAMHGDGDAATLAREVTNVGVTTSTGLPRSTSRVALLVAAGLFAAVGVTLAVVGSTSARRKAAATATETAPETAAPPPTAPAPPTAIEPAPATEPAHAPAPPTETIAATPRGGARPAPAASHPKPEPSKTPAKPTPTANPIFLP